MSQVFEKQYEDLKDKLINLMAKEISKLKEKVNNIEQEFQTFKEVHTLEAIASMESNQELQAQQTTQLKKTETLSKNINRISEQLSNVDVEIDNLRQLMKENNVRVIGLPENDEETGELKEKIVVFSKEQLKFPDFNEDDIAEVHHLGKSSKDKTRDIIIKFKDREVRNKFYQQRKKLYSDDIRKSLTGIYINEDLTQYRQRLYFDTRNLRKRSAIYAVWTSSGTIMVKLKESCEPQPIKTHRDLANLLRQNNIEV